MAETTMNEDVPYLSRGMLEVQAGLLLHAYEQAKRKTVIPPVPVDSIMESFLKLKFSFMDMREIFGVGDVAGALWMETAEVGVDHSLDPEAHPRMEGRYNFTVAHELGHWQLHRRYKLRKADPMLPFAPDEVASSTYVCRSSTRNRAEFQADLFASSLLMPRPMVLVVWRELYGNGPMTIDGLRRHGHAVQERDPWMHGSRFPDNENKYYAWLREGVVRPLASKFRVSRQAIGIRLDELGLLPKDFPLPLT